MDPIKMKFFGLTSEMGELFTTNQASEGRAIVDVASDLRNLLKAENFSLSRKEKVDVLKMMNRAKVRAFLGRSPDAFRTLDSISNEVILLL